MKVYVKINPKIAAKGSGFSDIAGKQEIYPPYEDGSPVIDKQFELESTPFVEQKIATGELVLLKREEEKKPESSSGETTGSSEETVIKVNINGEAITAITVAKDESERNIKKAVFANEKVISALNGRKNKGVTLQDNIVEITAE